MHRVKLTLNNWKSCTCGLLKIKRKRLSLIRWVSEMSTTLATGRLNITATYSLLTLIACLLLTPSISYSQTNQPTVVAVRAGRMLDVKSGTVVTNAVVLIENGRVKSA